MKNKVKTIDLTPTWPEAFTILLAVMENGTPEGRKEAREQLMKAAEFTQMASEFFQAAKARINGDFDNKYLKEFGLLMVNGNDDLIEMLNRTLDKINLP